jgi:hypothetical protein
MGSIDGVQGVPILVLTKIQCLESNFNTQELGCIGAVSFISQFVKLEK